MNLDKFIDEGLTISEISQLKKFEKKGYNPELIYAKYQNYDFKKLLEDLEKYEIEEDNIDNFLNAKESGDNKLLNIICDKSTKTDIKPFIIKLSEKTNKWNKLYKTDTSKTQIKNYIKVLNEGIDVNYILEVPISKTDASVYKELKTCNPEFNLESYIEKRMPMFRIQKNYTAFLHGFNLENYIKDKNFRQDQIEGVLNCLLKNKEICDNYKDIIFNEEYDPSTMDKILRLKEDGFPIEVLKDKKWNRGQLQMLKQIYSFTNKNGIDFNQFLNPNLKVRNFEAAYSALLRGLDYTMFLKEIYSDKRIKNILDALAYNKANPEDTLDMEYFINRKVPDHLLSEMVDGVKRSSHKLDTKLKFYAKLNEQIKESEILEEVR